MVEEPSPAPVDVPSRTSDAHLEAGAKRATYAIAAAICLAQIAMNFWLPLLPLYMQELGAKSTADALFWTAVANIALGVARIVSGPLWGIASDRWGRKPNFMRTLLFAALTILIAAAAQAPWQVPVAFAVQGLLSGFNPAAVALMSVSVPESRMGSSLSILSGGQYLGTTIGPALGAFLVLFLGFRGAMAAGAILPLLAILFVLFGVARDEVRPRRRGDAITSSSEAKPARLPAQFFLAVLVFFVMFAMNQVLRVLTPIVLQGIEGTEDVAGISGVAFSVSGLAAVIGVVFLGQRLVRPGRLRRTLIAGSVIAAAAHALLAVAHVAPIYVALFAFASLVQATLIPAANTLIATSISRDRRGTGFGIASSAQAVGLMLGPTMAAGFAVFSLDLAFVAIGLAFLGLAALALFAVREPAIEAGDDVLEAARRH